MASGGNGGGGRGGGGGGGGGWVSWVSWVNGVLSFWVAPYAVATNLSLEIEKKNINKQSEYSCSAWINLNVTASPNLAPASLW